eukprot:TRINITY_DN1185_c0_g1_i1.p1 TRINITY_DN1185_c0_g1~~TRINITY_DN1185_c0_g1_i1.p1  ORF type:complete len:459 (+),score=100.99 TRINITY_DN1185_c0_g1_i1:48-1424(+)
MSKASEKRKRTPSSAGQGKDEIANIGSPATAEGNKPLPLIKLQLKAPKPSNSNNAFSSRNFSFNFESEVKEEELKEKPEPVVVSNNIPPLCWICLNAMKFIVLDSENWDKRRKRSVEKLVKSLFDKSQKGTERWNYVQVVGSLFPQCSVLDFSDMVLDYSSLFNCRNLTKLNFTRTLLNDDDLFQILAYNKYLQELDLSGCRWITFRGVNYISEYGKSLKALILNENPQLTGKILFQLSQSHPHLKALGLSFLSDFYSLHIELLKKFPQLVKLDIGGCQHLNYFNLVLGHLPHLTSLNLSHITDLSDSLLLSFLPHLKPQLTFLSLSHSSPPSSSNILTPVVPLISRNTLLTAIHQFPQLNRLYLSDQMSVDDRVFHEILRLCKELKILDVSRTNFTGNDVKYWEITQQTLETLIAHGCKKLSKDIERTIKNICPGLKRVETIGCWDVEALPPITIKK